MSQESSPQVEDDEDHYEECLADMRRGFRCRCEQINAEEEAYYAEPPDMFAREWGCY
ncbi:hypothetical protein [Streptomyces sp. NPDC018693]|uniref:hypothetical protein n=1 Tax=unclassified Streptomyces TaxID=2593676 RepID=UPI0037BE18A5